MKQHNKLLLNVYNAFLITNIGSVMLTCIIHGFKRDLLSIS